jgi:putative N6-adenine-specific DNA methylase
MTGADPSRFEIFASTAPGLESIAAGELKALGMRGTQEIGGVAFSGDLERIYKANLWLRTATRVTVRMGRFHASTFFELERRAKKLDWRRFLPSAGAVRLRVTCRKSKLYHSDAVAERVLGIIDRCADRPMSAQVISSEDDDLERNLSSESESASVAGEAKSGNPPSQLFVVRIVHDECEISADSSGELLHRRGYRQEIAKAPLRETIAAAMVLASGWKGRDALLDPMCGSGSIPIEAAMIARGIAPGLKRNFQFMDWPNFDSSTWNTLVDDAHSAVREFSGDIMGADRDAGAVGAAMRNAGRAGVADSVRFSERSLSASMDSIRQSESDAGWILTNPPYGIRVGDARELRDLYAALGNAVKEAPDWRVGILTSDSALVRQSKRAFAARFSTSNGGIPVGFWVSDRAAQKTDRSGERSRAEVSES